jgi:hypothetical protein
MPVSTGMAPSIWVKASSPPAEAPMPTIGGDPTTPRSDISVSGEDPVGCRFLGDIQD